MVATANAAALRARRRLGFLAVVALGAVAVLSVRLWALTVWQGEQYLEKAESRLDSADWLPTIRGRILDRQGRVLAEDVPAWDVAIHYKAIDGTWARERAQRAARSSLGRSLWARVTRDARQGVISLRLPDAEAELNAVLDEVARLCEVPRAQLDAAMERVRERVERLVERRRAQAEEGKRLKPIAEQQSSHVVVRHVPDAVAFALRKLADEYPGTIEVVDGTRRVHPWSAADVRLDTSTLPLPLRRGGTVTVHVPGVLDSVVGEVRDAVWAEDKQRRPFMREDGSVDLGGYSESIPDSIGASGLEAAYEDWLRGGRGQVRQRRDTEEVERTEPMPGKDLRLTIDAELQARVQAILNPGFGLTRVQPWQHGGKESLPDGTKLASAAVVIEVETGDVLAMASWPSRDDGAELTPAERSRLQPGLNRAAEAVYPPGSIVKPLIYAGAVAAGRLSAAAAIACNGHFYPEFKDRARCWIWRPEHGMATHSSIVGGPLSIEAALSRSCNIYFFSVAQKLGLRGVVEWYRELGLGRTLGTGLQGPLPADRRGDAGESAGIVPAEEDIQKLEARRDAFTTIILGIGQGPVAWTPLQAANAFATLARGGLLLDARVVRDDAALPPDRRTGSLEIPAEARRRALEGLRQAVESAHGTGHHVRYGDGTREAIFDVPGVRVMGKTGTAQAPPLVWDEDGDGSRERSIRGLDHAWFTGLVSDRGDESPRYAVAVLVEYGGSGGKTAGPVAEQVVQALLDEGYLGPERTDSAGNRGRARPRYDKGSGEPDPPEREDAE
jgi:penicillin-binding protein 2